MAKQLSELNAVTASSPESHPSLRPQPEQAIDLNDSQYFENRELSYIKFNLRVLHQAKNPEHPLLERLMFLLIFSSNLDEFFEIRMSGLRKQLDFGRQRPGPDGKYPEQVLDIIHDQVREALEEQYRS
jgi:polyphosphate kinase